jgi:hypothetical protein
VAAQVVCYVWGGKSAGANTPVFVRLADVTAPSAVGSATVAVTTSSDPLHQSPAVAETIIAATAPAAAVTPSTVAASVGSTSPAVATLDVAVTPSGTGALTGFGNNQGGGLTVTFPAPTADASWANSLTGLDTAYSGVFNSKTEFDGSTQIGYCTTPVAGTGAVGSAVTCYLYQGVTVTSPQSVTVHLVGVAVPPILSSKTSVTANLLVSSTSDPKAAAVPLTLVSPEALSTAVVAATPATPGAAATYSIGIAPGTLGALVGSSSYSGAGSVTVTLPAAVGVTNTQGSMYLGQNYVGYCTPVGSVFTCRIAAGTTVGAGQAATIVLSGLTNPATASTYGVTVSTSADAKPVSAPLTISAAAQAPTVTDISPTSGPVTGGTQVTVNGANFATDGSTTVKFGSVPATVNNCSQSSSQISCSVTTRADTVGEKVHVTVTTAAGTSHPTALDQFTYLPPAPTVTAVSPAAGPLAGPRSPSREPISPASRPSSSAVPPAPACRARRIPGAP